MATMFRLSFGSIGCICMCHLSMLVGYASFDVWNKTMNVSNSSVPNRFVISSNNDGDDVDYDDDNNSDFVFDYYRLNHPFNPLLMCGCVSPVRAVKACSVKWYRCWLLIQCFNQWCVNTMLSFLSALPVSSLPFPSELKCLAFFSVSNENIRTALLQYCLNVVSLLIAHDFLPFFVICWV